MKCLRSHIFLGCVLIVGATCSATAADPPSTPSAKGVEYFEKHIRPLLAKHCYECHSQREDSREGGLLLDSRAGWTVGGTTGAAIVPGDVDASLLIKAVRYTDPKLQMPPDKALSKSEISHLERWVKMGTPDPRDGTSTDDIRHGRPSDPVAGRNHWVFRPLANSQRPNVVQSDWPESPIDFYVLAQLEKASLRPVDDADRRTLARRTWFQLTGLPPTPEQMNDFLADGRTDAFERLVDQLLDSKQFGERWGRHWLDLARYADSNGLDENFLFREAWRYRNWVIDAVNTDKPFDRFLLEQIAGDLLPHDSIAQRDQQRIAGGFLVIGPKVLLGNNPKERIMDVADEQLDTIGRAVLGQTLGCARCHDHKFDPIPTADYYSLAGILTSTQVMQQRYMLGQQRVMEKLVGLGPNGNNANQAYEKYWRERPKLKETQKQSKTALKLLESGDAGKLTEFAKKHPAAIAENVADSSQPIAARVARQKSHAATIDKAIAHPPAIPPRAMIPAEVAKPADEHIRIAGQFDKPGQKVARGVLQVASNRAIEIPNDKSGRVELANWLTDVDHGAGHLAARVLANRIWFHLMGHGIVRTVDNFGRTGEPPSHPELLDHLANELIKSDWSVKSLIRQIVLSRSFALSSQHNAAADDVDPENRMLWRAHRRRLDPESIRDAMMFAAGSLNLQPMDSTVSYLGDQATAVGDNKNRRRTDFSCRSVYLPVIRNDLPELFEVFDFADPHATTGMRPQTMVATQGLYLLNDESVMKAAKNIADRVLADSEGKSDGQRVDKLYELVVAGIPTSDERQDLVKFVQATKAGFVQADTFDKKDDIKNTATVRAWAMAAHALVASSRFQILE